MFVPYSAIFRAIVTTESSIENGTQTHGKMNGFIFRHVYSMHALRLCGVNRIIIHLISLVKLVWVNIFNYGCLL